MDHPRARARHGPRPRERAAVGPVARRCGRPSGQARRCPARRPYGERGSASLELVVVVPAVVLVIALLTAGWRLWSVRSQVREAAAAGARAASLAHSRAEAEQAAAAAVHADLATMRSTCTDPAIGIDASAFAVPAGRDGDVGVDVSCRVPFTDLMIPMPGSLTASGRAGSRLDSYRERQP